MSPAGIRPGFWPGEVIPFRPPTCETDQPTGGEVVVQTLRAALAEWTDWDVAGYALAVSLGLMPGAPGFGRAKHVFWSDHPAGTALLGILDELVAAGVLDRRAEPDRQY